MDCGRGWSTIVTNPRHVSCDVALFYRCLSMSDRVHEIVNPVIRCVLLRLDATGGRTIFRAKLDYTIMLIRYQHLSVYS